MGIVPKGRRKRIAWYKARIAKWAEDPDSIGVPAEEVADLQSRIDAAAQAQRDQAQAQSAAQAATARMNSAIKAMNKMGAGIIQRVRTGARTSGVGIYGKAWIPKPRKRRAIAPPGQPYLIAAAIQQCGWLTLTWKCDNPRRSEGTAYMLYRKLNGQGSFALLGQAGKRKFIDRSVPVGTTSVEYQIQAFRSTCVGEVAFYTLNFGSSLRQSAKVAIARAA